MARFSLKSFFAGLSAAVIFSGAAQAMEIRQFDKMAVPDQSEYVGLIVQGAEKVLTDEGGPIWPRRSSIFLRPRNTS